MSFTIVWVRVNCESEHVQCGHALRTGVQRHAGRKLGSIKKNSRIAVDKTGMKWYIIS